MGIDFFEIKRKFNFLMQQLNGDEVDRMPDTIYHYTDFVGAKGILTSNLLWMTHTENVHDTSEIRHGQNILTNLINKQIENLSGTFKDFWSDFNKADLIKPFDYYVCSFCTEADSRTNWVEYGRRMYGYSIGINKSYISRILRCKQPLIFGLIRYTKPNATAHEEIEEQLTKYIDGTNKFLEQFFGTLKKETHVKKLLLEISVVLARFMIAEICCIKNEAYKDQREFRIVAMYPKAKPPELYGPDNKKHIHSPHFDHSEITEVWSGVRSPADECEELTKILNKHRLNGLKKSNIPERT